MRHNRRKHRLQLSPEMRMALIKNLSVELIDHKRIKTTLSKCRALRPYVEKLVTIAKKDTLANRRLIYAKLGNRDAVTMLFNDVAPKCKARAGGYTRIYKIADTRVGDGAKVALIEWVDK